MTFVNYRGDISQFIHDSSIFLGSCSSIYLFFTCSAYREARVYIFNQSEGFIFCAIQWELSKWSSLEATEHGGRSQMSEISLLSWVNIENTLASVSAVTEHEIWTVKEYDKGAICIWKRNIFKKKTLWWHPIWVFRSFGGSLKTIFFCHLDFPWNW